MCHPVSLVTSSVDTAFDRAALTARLPRGFVAREFRDSDRERLVELRNRELPEMQRRDASEWREWERIQRDETELRICVDGPDGLVVAMANVGTGFLPSADGAMHAGVGVAREVRRRGIGSTLLGALESVARERGAPTIRASASAAQPDSLAWAQKRGYREIGRRIESYIELASFDPAAFESALKRARASGVRLRTFADVLAERDKEGGTAFFRALWEAEAPMWDDIPWPTPLPHWDWERFEKLIVTSGRLIPECSIVALDGERIAGFTTTGRGNKTDGYTWMTGVAREHRGKGIAQALKVEAITRAKTRGMRALLTTNDEPNKAMRGINAKLGYQMLPADVSLERTLA